MVSWHVTLVLPGRRIWPLGPRSALCSKAQCSEAWSKHLTRHYRWQVVLWSNCHATYNTIQRTLPMMLWCQHYIQSMQCVGLLSRFLWRCSLLWCCRCASAERIRLSHQARHIPELGRATDSACEEIQPSSILFSLNLYIPVVWLIHCTLYNTAADKLYNHTTCTYAYGHMSDKNAYHDQLITMTGHMLHTAIYPVVHCDWPCNVDQSAACAVLAQWALRPCNQPVPLLARGGAGGKPSAICHDNFCISMYASSCRYTVH